jgi:hypothetical protein
VATLVGAAAASPLPGPAAPAPSVPLVPAIATAAPPVVVSAQCVRDASGAPSLPGVRVTLDAWTGAPAGYTATVAMSGAASLPATTVRVSAGPVLVSRALPPAGGTTTVAVTWSAIRTGAGSSRVTVRWRGCA